ncbi:Crp/Fnr family transcriptional regulator [Bradyrhizobium sp. 25ACV]
MTDHVPPVLDALDSSGCPPSNQEYGKPPMFHRRAIARPKARSFVKNSILARISLQDLAALGEFLEPIVLKERVVLQEPRRNLEHVYFIESGLVSLRIIAPGSIIETAVVGYRGAVGGSLIAGGNVTTEQAVVLFPGSALRIHVDDLRRVVSKRPNVLENLLRYSQTLNTHCAQTGLCGVRHELERRLACWLCLVCDTLDSNVLSVTHDYISAVLGLQRAGITRALNRFEEQGLIRKMRGILQVDNRERLEAKACCCYGIIASAYASLDHASTGERLAEAPACQVT